MLWLLTTFKHYKLNLALLAMKHQNGAGYQGMDAKLACVALHYEGSLVPRLSAWVAGA